MLRDTEHIGKQRTHVLCCDVPHHDNIPILSKHAACGSDGAADAVDDAEDETSWCRDRYLMAAPSSRSPVPRAGTCVCRWHCPAPTVRRGHGRALHPPLSSRTHPRRKSAARRGADTPKDLTWRLRHNCTQWHGEGECCCFSVLGWIRMSRSHHAYRVDRWISEGALVEGEVRALRHSSQDAICWLSVFFFFWSLLKLTQCIFVFIRR